MTENRGKQFEHIVKEAFLKVPNTSVVRLPDQTAGYLGGANHCDFIVYHKPFEYHIECKTTHSDRLSIYSPKANRKYGALTNTQWEGLLEADKVEGVVAGVIVWFINRDITGFFDIGDLQVMRDLYGQKSVRYDQCPYIILGKKKRVFFDYDMWAFFNEV